MRVRLVVQAKIALSELTLVCAGARGSGVGAVETFGSGRRLLVLGPAAQAAASRSARARARAQTNRHREPHAHTPPALRVTVSMRQRHPHPRRPRCRISTRASSGLRHGYLRTSTDSFQLHSESRCWLKAPGCRQWRRAWHASCSIPHQALEVVPGCVTYGEHDAVQIRLTLYWLLWPSCFDCSAAVARLARPLVRGRMRLRRVEAAVFRPF
jgi:hypothetical protein